ncbi:pyridoxamine 5'-phosphate oxidase family protein [Kitasatospora mediocidica]|uniref:pyridoxamine 5'-phosphate oxidase family protein n=1 Tax=Kitasatospora mediocidica TaxID=58352 RepID=UPI00068DE2DD|nr:pyridoxamine 5'-phosphate oxidase family protein [Kitasatospora mediocidica]
MDPAHPADRIETLSEAECLRLLATVPLGRVVYTAHALPGVLPVAFRVEPDGRLVLALLPGGTLSRALDGTVTAFQADDVDVAAGHGWSVTVHGHTAVVRDPRTYWELLRSGPKPWVPEPEPMFVVLTPELVVGQRLSPAPVGGEVSPRHRVCAG